jgi:DMSO/TMAO reductase YedYZ heme-binding membrane subunit
MPPARPNDTATWLDGWRLPVAAGVAIAALSVWLASMRGFEVDGVRLAIRFTARTSLLLFCLAFSASALVRLWPNAWTRWQRRNRRYIGLSFVASHGIHAIAIVLFAVMAPAAFREATSPASFIFGGLGYIFIVAMAATSFDRTAAAIGPRAWRVLHITGIYYLWFQFMVSFGMRIPPMPNYAWFLLPLLVVMAIRIVAAVRSRRQLATS